MPELMSRTLRIRRGWVDRLRGFDRLYETELTDGEWVIFGRGATWEASERMALRKWEAQFGQSTGVTEYDLQVEVQGEGLLVTSPRSGFRALYHIGEQQLTLQQRTECNDHELLLQAWEAANLRARKLGWIA